MEAVWTEEGVKVEAPPALRPHLLLSISAKTRLVGFLKVGRETLDQINSLHMSNGLLHRAATHHYPPFTPLGWRRRQWQRGQRMQESGLCVCEGESVCVVTPGQEGWLGSLM